MAEELLQVGDHRSHHLEVSGGSSAVIEMDLIIIPRWPLPLWGWMAI